MATALRGVTATESRTFIDRARRAQIAAAAIETIADLGYARASLARIAQRIGVSKGVISYHFAGKDELVQEVITDVLAKAVSYMKPQVDAESTGVGKLRAAIVSNLAFMGENRREMVAFYEIAMNTRGARSAQNPTVATILRQGSTGMRDLLTHHQAMGEFRPDFDPSVVAAAIRAAIDSVPPRLAVDPQFDVNHYGRELAAVFDVATRADVSRPARRRSE